MLVTFLRTGAHPVGLLCALALAATMLAGCAPEAEPTPTAAFASEEEAFAAAEETYRAYNDAVNEQRENESAQDPQEFLTGLALESDINSTRMFEENGVQIVGPGLVPSITGTNADLTGNPTQVTVQVCLDVSETQVVNSDGADVTPPDRENIFTLDVEFILVRGELLISNSIESGEDKC